MIKTISKVFVTGEVWLRHAGPPGELDLGHAEFFPPGDEPSHEFLFEAGRPVTSY